MTMNTLWAHLDDSGVYPLELLSYEVEGWKQMPAGTSIETAVTLMLVKGEWVERPAVKAPTVTRSKEGWVIAYDAPKGAVCDVVDRDLGWLDTVDATGDRLEFVLADAGPYQLEITAPLPWLGRTDNLVLA